MNPDDYPSSGCCWPIGEPGTAAFRFCCEPVEVPGKPYCQEHRTLSVINPNSQYREQATIADVQEYAIAHRIVPPIGSGMLGLLVAVNKHRRAAGLTPYSLGKQP